MKRLISSLIALAAGLVLASSAQAAATAGSTLTVTANMIAACSVATAAVNFGDVLGNGEQGTGDVSVNCAQGIPYYITLDAGLHYGADGVRRMFSATNSITYRLYKDFYTTEWGDVGYAGTYPTGSSLADSGSGAPQNHPVYGKIVSGPGPVGAYSDTVNVTVYY